MFELVLKYFFKEMKETFWKDYHKSVSTSKISHDLHESDHKSVLPETTHMSKSYEKK